MHVGLSSGLEYFECVPFKKVGSPPKFGARCMTQKCIAQFTGAVEYTDCISAEGYDPTNECPGYDT